MDGLQVLAQSSWMVNLAEFYPNPDTVFSIRLATTISLKLKTLDPDDQKAPYQ
jgi:hypothetical protein